MNERKMLARSTLCVLYQVTLLLPNLSVAEWVDMPQFSDENKIYRIPNVQQHDQFYKFRRGDPDNFSDDPRNASHTFRRPIAQDTHTTDDRFAERMKTSNLTPQTTTMTSYLIPEPVTDEYMEISEDSGTAVATEGNSADRPSSDRHDAISPTKSTVFAVFTTAQPSSSSTVDREQESPQDEYYNRTLKQDDGILQYLPMDILKSVHRTLSQPVSLEGKIHFLKSFEETLMSEIESRLVTTMTPRRKVRSADYYGHYGHDDHEDHSVGFPSVEGALMAISFLTFAVYLVRLVMLLFRNMNPPMMTTTTAATIFLGKRKRSVNFDDDTARILSNMNGFVSNF